MSWFTNEAEVELRGAIRVLEKSSEFKPVRLALQFLKGEQSIYDAARTLFNGLSEQARHIEDLENKLSNFQYEKQQADHLIESYRRDLNPNYERIQTLEHEIKIQLQQAEKEKTAAAELRFILERNNRLHEERVDALEERIRELNELVAEQHSQLESIVGSSRPPEETT
jgi:chromosome segregation ATPase